MKIDFNGKIDDISVLLVSAVRGALGRHTYIVQWICEVVVNNLHILTEKDKQVMIRTIKEHEVFGYGDECDKQEWTRLLAILEQNIKVK